MPFGTREIQKIISHPLPIMSNSKKNNRDIGNQGEEIAVSYLESKDYTILERNYFFERAEVDIVAYKGTEIIFVEVKTRSGLGYGNPEDAVTKAKQKSIFKASEAWLYERKMEGAPVRFDVISILKNGSAAPDIKHFENAFWYGD